MKIIFERPIPYFSTFDLIYKALHKILHEDDAYDLAEKLQSDFIDGTVDNFLNLFETKDVVKIESHDTWNCDITIAKILVPLLTKFKENLHGHPMNLEKVMPDHIKRNYSIPKNERTHETWKWMLDEMIFAFSQKDTDWEDQFYHYEMINGKMEFVGF